MLVSFVVLPGDLHERFTREHYVPAFNRLELPLRCCEECGRRFVPADRRDRFCSKNCSARTRNRGRSKGQSKAEAAAARRVEFARQHWRKCKQCVAGKVCSIREALANSDDAMSRQLVEFDETLMSGGEPASSDEEIA